MRSILQSSSSACHSSLNLYIFRHNLGATFFKDLLGKKKEHITTAYITGSPLNAEIVHSDWNRNGQAAASDLAYNQYGLAQPF